MQVPQRTAQVVCESAVDATAAEIGWVGVVDGGEVVVVAASSADPTTAASMVGRRLAVGAGSVGFVLQSGQPMALHPAGRTGGTATGADEPAAALLGRPPLSLLCAPCSGASDAVGVLQVLDKGGGGAFSFDDVEVVTLLGTVMGAALVDAGAASDELPPPARLGRDLSGLADTDPARYATVARLVDSLLRWS
jgi:sigma-B regulation protein RsbU (phosphoserine phosphatase)